MPHVQVSDPADSAAPIILASSNMKPQLRVVGLVNDGVKNPDQMKRRSSFTNQSFNTNSRWKKLKTNWSLIFSVILAGLSLSGTDFSTDFLIGYELLQKNHIVWGSLTFFFMWIPGVMVGIQQLWAFLYFKKGSQNSLVSFDEENPLKVLTRLSIKNGFTFDYEDEPAKVSELEQKKETYYELRKEYPLTILLCVFCFPAGFLLAQVWHIYAVVMEDKYMIKQFEFLCKRLRGFEAFFESGPQLTLQIFIVFYTKTWTETQLASICFSLLSLSSTAVISDMLYATLKDAKTTSVFLASVLPLYLSSVVFKVGSLSLTLIYLRYYAIIPIVFSCGLKAFVAYKLKFCFRDSLEMAVCNMTVVFVGPSEPKGKSKDGSRFRFMMFSTLISIVVFDSILIILAILFNLYPDTLKFWKNILINPGNSDINSLCSLNFIIGILILISFISLFLLIATKYTKLSQSGAQILGEVGNIVSKIDDLDNPEIKSAEVFNEIQNLSFLLDKPYIENIRCGEIIIQIENLCKLFHTNKCKGVEKGSQKILEAANNLTSVIEREHPGLSVANILHNISGLTSLLPHSDDSNNTKKPITDLKAFEEIGKIRSILTRPEVEVSSVHILNEVKDLLQLLDNPEENKVTFKKQVGTGKKIIDGIKSLRRLLKNPDIEVPSTQLLFEIKGFTDIFNTRNLEMASRKDEGKVVGSIKNLRQIIENFETRNPGQKYSENILEEINVLICKLDHENVTYQYDESTKKLV